MWFGKNRRNLLSSRREKTISSSIVNCDSSKLVLLVYIYAPQTTISSLFTYKFILLRFCFHYFDYYNNNHIIRAFCSMRQNVAEQNNNNKYQIIPTFKIRCDEFQHHPMFEIKMKFSFHPSHPFLWYPLELFYLFAVRLLSSFNYFRITDRLGTKSI